MNSPDHDESCPPVFLSHWDYCLGRPYSFNDLRAPGGNFGKKPYWLVWLSPLGGRAGLGSILPILPRHGSIEGVRSSVLKTPLSVHFGAWSSVRSFTDDESLLAILYCSPPAVLSFWLGGAELGSIALCRKCIGSPRSKPKPCVRRTADE